MIDNKLELDEILDSLDKEAEKKKTPVKKVSMEELDELLNDKLSSTDSKNKELADDPEAETPEADSADEKTVQEQNDKQEKTVGSASNDLKNAFGKSEEEKKQELKAAEKESKEDKKSENAPKKRPSSKKKKKKKKKVRFNGSIFGGIILVTIILTVSMVLAVTGISIGMEYYGIGKSDNEISFNIPKGSSNEKIAEILYENGIIKNKKLFVLAVRFQKPEAIYPGDITLKPSMGYSEIIEAMSVMRESYKTVTITFAEGEYLTDIAAKLEENEVCAASDFIFEFNKNQGFDFESRITDDPNTFYAREGYFFPDTYEFYVGDTEYNITKIVREHFQEKITDNMYGKMDRMGLTLNQVMTLASIVQQEAASVEEMPKVASVFINRLNDSDTYPMLQSDTTTNYIKKVITPQAGNDESIAHYTEYYDTYSCQGLPAGPICNPGLDAINAVLDHADTDYYYFCNNLETGETFYAKTLEEHEANLKLAGLA